MKKLAVEFKFQTSGQDCDKGPDLFPLSYHTFMYGVLTARGMAAGKRVCKGPCAPTRDEKAGRNRKAHSGESNMAGKWMRYQTKGGHERGRDQEDVQPAKRRGR